MLKLNARLDNIYKTISTGYYDEIWDCCCDHGYLGMKILQANLCATVHFVDQVASITAALDKKMRAYGASNYDIITASAADLSLAGDKKHLVILAGVSGNTVIDILQGLQLLNPQLTIDYLLSPNYQLFDVREYLASNNFSLLHETLVFENAQTYEVIHVTSGKSPQHDTPVSLTGNMWKMANPQHRHYLEKLIDQYEKKAKSNPGKNILRALDSYKKIKPF